MKLLIGIIIGILIMILVNFIRDNQENFADKFEGIVKTQWIRFNKYFVWFIINFGFGLIPFFIHLSNEGDLTRNGFLSVVSFAFTLIVSSTYLFSAYIKNLHFDETLTILCILLCIALAFLYLIVEIDRPIIISNFVRDNLQFSLFCCLGFVLLASLSLNMRAIEKKVKNAIDQAKLSQDNNKKVDTFKVNV